MAEGGPVGIGVSGLVYELRCDKRWRRVPTARTRSVCSRGAPRSGVRIRLRVRQVLQLGYRIMSIFEERAEFWSEDIVNLYCLFAKVEDVAARKTNSAVRTGRRQL